LPIFCDPEVLATWAHKVLPLKNQLSKENAQTVEIAFAAKLNELNDPTSTERQGREASESVGQAKPDASQVIIITKPTRERDRNHLRSVATQPCLICGRAPSDAHHLKFAEQPAMGRKVSDKFTVPICRLHHRDLHRRGKENSWWEERGIDPLPIAAKLWTTSNANASASNDDTRAVEREPALNGNRSPDSAGIKITKRSQSTVSK